MTKAELDSNKLYTINKLSELTSYDRRTIAKRLTGEEPDHVQGGKNYFELNRVIEVLEEAAGKGTDKAKLECKKLISQIRNIDLRNDELAKRLIPSDEIARVWLAHVSKARASLLAIEELAPVLVGLEVNAIKAKLKEATLDIIEELNKNPVDE